MSLLVEIVKLGSKSHSNIYFYYKIQLLLFLKPKIFSVTPIYRLLICYNSGKMQVLVQQIRKNDFRSTCKNDLYLHIVRVKLLLTEIMKYQIKNKN